MSRRAGVDTMLADRTTLNQFLTEERRRHPAATGEFTALVNDVALACKAIAKRVAYGAIDDVLGSTATTNVQGETQQKLDVLANELFLRTNEWGGHLAGMVSEEMEAPLEYSGKFSERPIPARVRSARWFIQHRCQRLRRQYFFDPESGCSGCRRRHGRLLAAGIDRRYARAMPSMAHRP